MLYAVNLELNDDYPTDRKLKDVLLTSQLLSPEI